MKATDLHKLGVPDNKGVIKEAFRCLGMASKARLGRGKMKTSIRTVCTKPDQHVDDPVFGTLAQALVDYHNDLYAVPDVPVWHERETPAPYESWGKDLDKGSITQMENACRLPVAVRAALMPDAHTGYGLPIGGVLATRGAVIPYAVGVDISCSMNFTITDMPINVLKGERKRLINVLEAETAFGMGSNFRDNPRDHGVLDSDKWNEVSAIRCLKDKAWRQLGSSGGGNHFVEFGVASFEKYDPELGLDPGEYLAIMSHSGSRGPGATLASYYTKLAQAEHPELPKELRHLAWLDLDSEAGQEYWFAMNLMGEYAEACHRVIHREMIKSLRCKSLANVYNRHNFAWIESHGGEDLVVHRKGATPAEMGQMGIIPGSMSDPAFVVRGKGNAGSLRSASHGAGRLMSRKQAELTVDRKAIKKVLREKEITVLSAGWDESSSAYKDIHEVMALQEDLVHVIGRFDPKIVKMAPAPEQRKWQKFAKQTMTNLKN